MTIDEAKRHFSLLLSDIEREMNTDISEVRIVKQSASVTFNGKPYERNEVKVTIIFG